MNIGLVAMSGIRACDEELLRLGLTLPGFLERSKVIASLPSLGLLTLAGMTPDGHAVRYIEMPEFKGNGDGAALAKMDGLDLVAISTFSAQIPEAYALADACRAQGIRVVMGGLHVTCMSDEAAQHCDAVVLGEGELAWEQVVRDAAAGHLKTVYDVRAAEFDLADAPMPAYELLDLDTYNRLTVQTSRGCPFKCEFCASSILLTPRYKQKPIAKVLAEVDRICELWAHPFIEFADDNTFVNKAYWRELLDALAQRKLRWFTETDISVADDEALLSRMRAAGCAQVLIGLESPTQPALQGVELRTNWKQKRWPEYRDAIRRIQSHGISVNGCFVLGLDGHDGSVFEAVYEFVRDAGLHEVQITLQTPFPGTPLYERLAQAGRLTHAGQWERCTLFDLNFTPAQMSADELVSGFRDLAVRLYDEDCTRQRRDHFKQMLRASRANN
jgi:radical SAM superfamily enzyme YgiQ (UPF0313 family)